MDKLKYMKIIFFIFFTLFANFLVAQESKIVAHRGGVNWGPENTITTFLIAIDKGVNYIEMDVRQTKDGTFILMHDKDFSRTTNGKGLVSELTIDEIKNFDAGSWYNMKFKNERIPTLREVLRAIDGKVLPDIDFKDGDPAALVQLLEEEGFLNGRPLTLYSGNHQLIAEIQKLTDKILVRPSIKTSYQDLKENLNPPIVNLSWRKFSSKLQKEIRASNAKTFVNCLFVSNRKRAIKKAVKLKPDFIQTDKLDFLIKQLERLK